MPKGNTKNLKPFQPGQSGNPGGRPAVSKDVIEAARAHTTDAIKTLATVMNNNKASDTARVGAANSLLDRAWGKPDATLKIKDARDVRELSRAELLEAIATARAAEQDGSAGQPSQVH